MKKFVTTLTILNFLTTVSFGAFTKRQTVETVGEEMMETSFLEKSERAGFVQGTGSIQCVLQGSGKTQKSIKGVGYFRCNFHGAQMRSKGNVDGVGWYQCIYQEAGSLQNFEQGVGHFSCFFQGVREAIGFETSNSGNSSEKNAFIEVMALWKQPIGVGVGQSNNPNPNPGFIQLLGFYQYGPEGAEKNYGEFQAIESFNFQIQNETIMYKNITKMRHDYVTQTAGYEYDFAGAEIDQGRGQIANQFTYNMDHLLEKYGFSFTVGRYEYLSQITREKQDLVQFLLQLAKCSNPFCSPFANHSEVVVVYQWDIGGNSAQFVQFFAEIQRDFLGQSDLKFLPTFISSFVNSSGTVKIQMILQVNLEGTGATLLPLTPPSGEEFPSFVEMILSFFYRFNGLMNNHFDGYISIYGLANYFFNRSEESEAYILTISQFNYYSLPLDEDDEIDPNDENDEDNQDDDEERKCGNGGYRNGYNLTLQSGYIFNTDDEQNEGYIQLYGAYNIHTLFDDDDIFDFQVSKNETFGKRWATLDEFDLPGLLQLVGVLQCSADVLKLLFVMEKKGKLEKYCFFQMYFLYTRDIPNSGGVKSKGSAQFMGQYFTEF